MNNDQLDIGCMVVFDMPGAPNIGIITDIYMAHGVRKCAIMQPSGRMRERSLDYDYEHKWLAPLLGEWNTMITSKAWQEWIEAGKPPKR